MENFEKIRKTFFDVEKEKVRGFEYWYAINKLTKEKEGRWSEWGANDYIIKEVIHHPRSGRLANIGAPSKGAIYFSERWSSPKGSQFYVPLAKNYRLLHFQAHRAALVA